MVAINTMLALLGSSRFIGPVGIYGSNHCIAVRFTRCFRDTVVFLGNLPPSTVRSHLLLPRSSGYYRAQRLRLPITGVSILYACGH